MRIGFCCKWLNDKSEFGGMKVNAKDRDLNGRSTTMRWLREHPNDAEQRQWDIMNHKATQKKIGKHGGKEKRYKTIVQKYSLLSEKRRGG